MSNKQRQAGFTIVELLVVIVIIGILAAITVVSYIGIQQKAVVASLTSDLDNSAKLLKLDQVVNSGYPTSLANANGGKGINLNQGDVLAYQYDNSSSPQTFCITARNGSTVYNITNDSAPKAGGCTTDGVADNGLVLNLDAGTTVSYPGSNTTWYDLNSNGNHVTLTNGPTYDGANSGSVVFDGSNDYADFYAPNLTTVATIEMWAKISTSYAEKMFFGWNSYDVYTANGSIGYNTSNGDSYGFSSITATALGVANNWKHYVFEMHSDVSYSNNKIYVNGVSQTLSQLYVTENTGLRTFNSGKGRIASWKSSGSYYMPMSLGAFRVYNRALTQSEVTQNFNALRSRYGI